MTQIFEKEDFEVRYAKEKDEYKTFDNSPVLGKELPTLKQLTDEEGNVVMKDGVEQDDEKFGNIWDQLEPLQINDKYPMPKFGEQVVVVLFWGKYYGKYPSDFAAVWDKDYTVKKVFMKFGQDKKGNPIDANFQFCCGALPVPTAFVFDKNKKCVWYQNHSNVVNDAATYMALMEEQLDLIIEGKAPKSAFGEFEPEEDSD